MRHCYYTCNLLPLDFAVRAGYSPRWLGNHLLERTAATHRDSLSVHPLTCPYVTKLLAAAEEVLRNGQGPTPGASDRLVVPGGCDAMRRLGDLLAAVYPERVRVIHMPRTSSKEAVTRLSTDLEALDQWLADGNPSGPTPSAAAEPGAEAVSPAIDYPKPPRPGGVFVVSGPLSDDSLLDLIGKLGSHVSGLESCTSPDRWKALAPRTSTGSKDKSTSENVPDYKTLALQVLGHGMCPRRSTEDRRAHLERRLDESRPNSIIYARQSFCDPGAYDSRLVAELARERSLPYLEIEVDFPFDANGPLRTRVEAFLEAQLLEDDLLDLDELFEEV